MLSRLILSQLCLPVSPYSLLFNFFCIINSYDDLSENIFTGYIIFNVDLTRKSPTCTKPANPTAKLLELRLPMIFYFNLFHYVSKFGRQ